MSLARLAARHGVATSYAPSAGVSVQVPDATVVTVLAALGVAATTEEEVEAALTAAEEAAAARILPATVVHWVGAAGPPPALTGLPPGTLVRLTPEGGGQEAQWRTPQEPPPLPLGVHRVTVHPRGGETLGATLIVAPERAPAPCGRVTGLLVQLYSLLSQRSWGMGDLGDLSELAAWSGRTHGIGFLQVNPLHAAVPGDPTDPSPYRPSSRRFPDPVHLRIEDVPRHSYAGPAERAALEELSQRVRALRRAVLEEGALIDRDAVWALKREALEVLWAVPAGPGERASYCEFLAEQGRALEDHATWCALVEEYGADCGVWPAGLEDPCSAQTAQARRSLWDRVDFHCWLAYLTDLQLSGAQRVAREAGMPLGLVHDLAVGVHPGGADAWAQRAAFAVGMSVGAPPDAFNARGQDWGLPPWRPDVLASLGYAPYRALLRGLFKHAGALRIDHVMGLFRLWWVPAGCEPCEGTYVSYDHEAMLAVLVLEAHRAGAVVIGEDLGTVEPGVREVLARRGVLGTSVLWFERDWAGDGRPLAPARWRADCLATVTTHDLPPTAARLSGEHLELRDRLGLLTRSLAQERVADAADTREWLILLSRLGLLDGVHAGEEAAVLAVHRYLLATPARLIGLWLPDAVGDRRPQNLPGTSHEYPNWRLPVSDRAGRPVTLEDLAASPRAHALFSALRAGERAAPAPRTATPDARRV
ncbi:4-alpha-glucanotransferase [Streptomyces sp. NPDC006879]|uniref:4-alpha-glucanotransferase n=1 Tax=Streptomyces sp. NPDC006879 TaxID=3364767 RepID=UPI00367CF154